jgi:hypothetical protein
LAAERPEANDRLCGEVMIGVSQHYLGDLPSARCHLEHVLVGYVTPDQTSHIIRFHTDQRVVMSAFLGRVLWLQGFPDQAMRVAHSSVEDARAANHTISLCVALAYAACPLALLTGDLAAAEHYSAMLLDHSTRHALALWRACGRAFQGVLVIQRGGVITGLRLLRAGFDEIGEVRCFSLVISSNVDILHLRGRVLVDPDRSIFWESRLLGILRFPRPSDTRAARYILPTPSIVEVEVCQSRLYGRIFVPIPSNFFVVHRSVIPPCSWAGNHPSRRKRLSACSS